MSDTDETEITHEALDAELGVEARFSVVENPADKPADLPYMIRDGDKLIARYADQAAAEAYAETLNAAERTSDDEPAEPESHEPLPERGPTTPGKPIVGNDPVELYGIHRPREPWEL